MGSVTLPTILSVVLTISTCGQGKSLYVPQGHLSDIYIKYKNNNLIYDKYPDLIVKLCPHLVVLSILSVESTSFKWP